MAKCVGQRRVPSGGRTRLARSDVLEDLGDERRVGDGGDDKPYQTDPYYRGEGLVPGGSIECEPFPRVR